MVDCVQLICLSALSCSELYRDESALNQLMHMSGRLSIHRWKFSEACLACRWSAATAGARERPARDAH